MKTSAAIILSLYVLLDAATCAAEPAMGSFHPPMPKPNTDHSGVIRRSTRLCNGYSDLCERKFDKVSYPTTHNSFAQGDNIAANQNKDIKTQLDNGIRGFMLDLHNPSKALLRREKRADIVPTLCHASCAVLNAGPLVDELKNFKKFLDSNANEVVTVFLENADNFSPLDMAQPFIDSGLDKYAFEPSTSNGTFVWPTLNEMISMNKRLVVLGSTSTDSTSKPWLLYDRDFAVQTSYSVKAGSPFDCNPLTAIQPLLVMNHFVSVDRSIFGLNVEIPDYNSALSINTRESIVQQANVCGAAGRFPTFVAVDFYDAGGVFKAVADLNKVKYVESTATTFDQTSSSSTSGAAAVASGMLVLRTGLAGIFSVVVASLLSMAL